MDFLRNAHEPRFQFMEVNKSGGIWGIRAAVLWTFIEQPLIHWLLSSLGLVSVAGEIVAVYPGVVHCQIGAHFMSMAVNLCEGFNKHVQRVQMWIKQHLRTSVIVVVNELWHQEDLYWHWFFQKILGWFNSTWVLVEWFITFLNVIWISFYKIYASKLWRNQSSPSRSSHYL